MTPRHPIYIPSRGRPDACLTARALRVDEVPFRIVVAPFEADAYRKAWSDAVVELPADDWDIVAVRNWIKAQAIAAGAERHWQLDDNIRLFRRWWRRKRVPCHAGVALRVCEDFADRYENVALAGLDYTMFAVQGGAQPPAPFRHNVHVYSCTLVLNSLPYAWRGPYNDDTDLCLQVLSGGWCTLLIQAFMADKMTTMTMRGGMTDANTNNYQGDGRLRMARTLERRWPGVVKVTRRWQRPQHFVNWRKFDTPLRLKPGVDLAALPAVDDYGLRLEQVAEIKSPRIRAMLEELKHQQ